MQQSNRIQAWASRGGVVVSTITLVASLIAVGKTTAMADFKMVAGNASGAPGATGIVVQVTTGGSDTQNVGGADVGLMFDPNVLTVTDRSLGSGWTLGSTMFTANSVENANSTGQVRPAIASMAEEGYDALAPGAEVFTVTFSVKPGAACVPSNLTVYDWDLQPPDDVVGPAPATNPILYTAQAGVFTVLCPTATPTFTPTSPATATPTETSIDTPTNTPIATSTSTDTSTPTATPTPTITPTFTETPTPSSLVINKAMLKIDTSWTSTNGRCRILAVVTDTGGGLKAALLAGTATVEVDDADSYHAAVTLTGCTERGSRIRCTSAKGTTPVVKASFRPVEWPGTLIYKARIKISKLADTVTGGFPPKGPVSMSLNEAEFRTDSISLCTPRGAAALLCRE